VIAMNGYDALVSQLEARGDTPEKRAAMRTLYAAGEDAKPALVAGLDHPAWRVRHGCLRVLDHAVVDDATRVRVVRALSDPHRKVRQSAIHLLGCEVCKPAGFCGIDGVDIDGVHLKAVAADRSRRVRKAAIGHFMWQRGPIEPRVEAAMRAVIEGDDDIELRKRAAHVLAFPEMSTYAGSAPERYAQLLQRVDVLLGAAPDLP
jgi:hypothetical protein